MVLFGTPFLHIVETPLPQLPQFPPSPRRYIVLPPARIYHFYDVKIRLRIRNLGKGLTAGAVPDMTEEKAVDLGSQLAAEIVLMVAASAIAYRDKVAVAPYERS